MAAPIDRSSLGPCGSCKKTFDSTEVLCRLKECGHAYHASCLNNACIQKVGEVVQKVLCTTCNKTIAEAKEGSPIDFPALIEVIPGVRPPANPSSAAPAQPVAAPSISQKDAKGLKYVAWGAIVLVSMIIACVAYPSLLAIGIGAAVSLPIGYWVSKKIEHYLIGG